MESDKCSGQFDFKIYIYGLLMLTQSMLFAQTPVVKNTATDKTYANTTEIQKAKNASVEQVLDEIDKDYGLGDVVRITDAPPPKPVVTTPTINRAEKPIEVRSKTPVIPTTSQPVVTSEVLVEKNTRSVKLNNTPEPPLNPIYTEGVKKGSKTVSEKKVESVSTQKTAVLKNNSVKTSKNYTVRRGSSNYNKKSFFYFLKKSKPKTTKRRVPKSNGQYGCYKF